MIVLTIIVALLSMPMTWILTPGLTAAFLIERGRK